MSDKEKKPCIQERIKIRLRSTRLILRAIFSNPWYIFLLSVLVMFSAFSPTIPYLKNLDYSKIRDLVQFIVMADTSMLAFTGVISSMILKHVLDEEKELKGVYSPPTKNDFKKKRIISFIGLALMALFFSILFGFYVIITQEFVLQVILSLVFLCTAFIQISLMIYYSLK